MTRHYEHWPGKGHFLCGGRVMIGSSPLGLSLTLLLLLGASGLWMSVVAIPHWNTWMVATGAALLALTLYFLARCALTDPGILPRCPAPPPGAPLPEPPAHVYRYDGSNLVYCDTCSLFRPPRAKHCRYSDNCVLEFDHFCPWVGTAVGLRNLRFFLAFVTSTFALALFIALTSGLEVRRRAHTQARAEQDDPKAWTRYLGDAVAAEPSVAAVGIFGALVALSLISLLVYHAYLVSIAETTNENLRNTYLRHVNPYDRGCLANWRRVLCAPLPPSQLEFLTEEVREGQLPGMGTDVAEVARRARCLPRSGSGSEVALFNAALSLDSSSQRHAHAQFHFLDAQQGHLNTPQGYIPPSFAHDTPLPDDYYQASASASATPVGGGSDGAADDVVDPTHRLLPLPHTNGNGSSTRMPPQ